MGRDELLALEARGWRTIEEAVRGLGTDRLEHPGMNGDGWSIKDLLWHLARWHEEAARVIGERTWDAVEASTGPAWVDGLNAEALAESRGMGLEEVRSGGRDRRGRMREAFEALEDPPASAVEWFEESGTLHYREHADELARWTGRLRSER
jgi:hypothetical protein